MFFLNRKYMTQIIPSQQKNVIVVGYFYTLIEATVILYDKSQYFLSIDILVL